MRYFNINPITHDDYRTASDFSLEFIYKFRSSQASFLYCMVDVLIIPSLTVCSSFYSLKSFMILDNNVERMLKFANRFELKVNYFIFKLII